MEYSNHDPVVTGKCLPILDMEGDKMEINTEAFNSVLDEVGNRPFVVYTISGATRTGKTYALNHFLRYLQWKEDQQSRVPQSQSDHDNDWLQFPTTALFASQSGRDRVTRGINLWSKPYFVNTRDGEVAVLLMDTQGLFDEKTTAKQNAIIFAVSNFCSSVMIFNVMRLINDNLLQQMEYFSNYALSVAPVGNANGDTSLQSGPTASSLRSNNRLQNLMFLLRDFELTEYEYGLHSETSKPNGSEQNYFLDTFHLPGGSLESNGRTIPEENKLVRRKIRKNFEQVSMYLLPEPGRKFLRQQDGSSVQPDQEFLENLEQFVHMLTFESSLLHCRKTYGGKVVTGLTFKDCVTGLRKLCQDFEEIFKDVRTPLDNASFTEYSIATRMAISSYQEIMVDFIKSNCQSGSPASEDALEAAHEDAKQSVHKMFLGMIGMKNEKYEREFSKQLHSQIQQSFVNYREQNEILKEKASRGLELEQTVAETANELSRLKEQRESLEQKRSGGHFARTKSLGAPNSTLPTSNFSTKTPPSTCSPVGVMAGSSYAAAVVPPTNSYSGTTNFGRPSMPEGISRPHDVNAAHGCYSSSVGATQHWDYREEADLFPFQSQSEHPPTNDFWGNMWEKLNPFNALKKLKKVVTKQGQEIQFLHSKIGMLEQQVTPQQHQQQPPPPVGSQSSAPRNYTGPAHKF